MFFLAYFSSGWYIHLLLCQLIVISLLPLNLTGELATALILYTNMPVTTRSQTTKLKNSLLYTESSTTSNSSSTIPSLVSSYVHATNPTNSTFDLPVLNSPLIATAESSLSSRLDCQVPVISSALDFQTYPGHFKISQFSNLTRCCLLLVGILLFIIFPLP
jgi:hypothetical protein